MGLGNSQSKGPAAAATPRSYKLVLTPIYPPKQGEQNSYRAPYRALSAANLGEILTLIVVHIALQPFVLEPLENNTTNPVGVNNHIILHPFTLITRSTVDQ